MYASGRGQVEVLDTLLQHGARVDLKQNVRNYIRIVSLVAFIIIISIIVT